MKKERERIAEEREAKRKAELAKLKSQKAWLNVTIEKCESLRNMESAVMGSGKSDPYVKVKLKGADGKPVAEMQTETQLDVLDPVFQTTFEFECDMAMMSAGEGEASLELEVWDSNVKAYGDTLMGKVYKGVAGLKAGITQSEFLEGAKTKDGAGRVIFKVMKETDEEHEKRIAKEKAAQLAEDQALQSQQMYLQVPLDPSTLP